jgi:hypothetical protein
MRSSKYKSLNFVSVLALAVLAVSIIPVTTNAHCDGKHTGNHPHCDGGGDPGGGDGGANPAFVYIKPANGAKKTLLANADGSAATEIFVGTKFSFAQQPALFGDSSGGEVLINDFSNLYRISYSVNSGVISVDSTDKIQDRDIGPTTHTSNPDWSPDGSDFAFKSGTSVYVDSRATYVSGVVMDFGDPLYKEDRTGPGTKLILGVAWDAAGVIHLTMGDPTGDGWELRSLNIADCSPTCDSTNTTCIAATISSTSCPAAQILGATRLEHVSVSHEPGCTGNAPRIMVSADDANGDPLTFVLDGSMPVMDIANFDGNDWTPNCTIIGSPGEGAAGPLNGGAIVEYDPYSGLANTLIGKRGETPDWSN